MSMFSSLSPQARRAVGILAAAFIGGVVSTFLSTGGDLWAVDGRALVNAGVASAATVLAAWLLPFYRGLGIGSRSPVQDGADGPDGAEKTSEK